LGAIHRRDAEYAEEAQRKSFSVGLKRDVSHNASRCQIGVRS